MFWYTALPYLLFYAVRQWQPPLPCRPLHLPHPSVQCFGMTGTPLKLRTRHGESPITAARTSDFQLFVRKGIAFQSVPLHFGSSGGSTRHSPSLHSIALLYTPYPFGRSRKKAVGRADSTLSAKSGMAEAMDKKVVRLLCRARPTGALPFYPSPLPHYRPMGRAARGRSMSGGGGH